MATISDLPLELVEEILSRAPLTSLNKVRLTSTQWNALSKNQIVCKGEAKQQFLGFVKLNFKVYSVRFNLQSDLHGEKSVKKIGKLDNFIVHKVFHCDGLVLCKTSDSRLVAWNPYLGQTRVIQPKTRVIIQPRSQFYSVSYGLGYDFSCRYKILRVSLEDFYPSDGRRIVEHEIYDFDSDSWRALDVTPDRNTKLRDCHGVSLKGNAYWCAYDDTGQEKIYILHCFDFTRERFGPPLELPSFQDHWETNRSLACVREEQLAILLKYENSRKMEIWVTTKIEPEFVSWSKFLVFETYPGYGFTRWLNNGRFFIDQEKKVAWLFDCEYLIDEKIVYNVTSKHNIAFVVGENEYYKEIDLGESNFYTPVVCSYVPSLVQLEK